MTHHLKEACRQLRLSGLAPSLDLRLQEATANQLPHAQFLESTVGGNTVFTYDGALALDAGYYTLDVFVDDGVVPVFSQYRRVVRIFTDLGTSAVISVDLSGGSVNITIDVDRQDPLVVGLSGAPVDPVAQEVPVVLTAGVSGGTGVYTYRWYLNGVLRVGEEGTSITLNAVGDALPLGRNQVSLVASDGTAYGSNWVTIDVTE